MSPLKQKAFKLAINVIGIPLPSVAAQKWLEIFSSPRRIARPPWEVKLVERAKRFKLAGLQAYEWGNGEKTIVLVHGWQGRGTQLGFLVNPLLERGCRVVAIDFPAHGESSGKRTNIRFASLKLQEVVKELGPTYAIIAHSFGGGATAIALSENLPIQKAVLVAAPGDIGVVIDQFAKAVGMSKRVQRSFYSQIEEWAKVKVGDLSIIKRGKDVRVPILVAHAPDDHEVPFANAEMMVAGWPSAKLARLEGVGHRKILKAPAFIDECLRFLFD